MKTPSNMATQSALHIPVDDDQASLHFCQSLAHALVGQNNGFVEHIVTLPGTNGARTPARKPVLSIVLPVFNEEENLPELHRRLTAMLQAEGIPYEIIFVDDGSTELLRALAADNRRVKAVELARNFGHQVAISAGLDFAQGDAVIVMDADLQDPPEMLPQFIAEWRAGNDVVYAIREQCKERWPSLAQVRLTFMKNICVIARR